MRSWVGRWSDLTLGVWLPYGTFMVNLTGCFLVGILWIILVEKGWLDSRWQHFLLVGFLGSMTTFSTFSLQTVILLQTGRLASALFYIAFSLLTCILGTFLGILFARWLV